MENMDSLPRIALTATADERTRRDMMTVLQLEDAPVFLSSFDRPNIRYTIVEKDNGRKQLLDFIRLQPEGEAGIVYCLSRKREPGRSWRRVRCTTCPRGGQGLLSRSTVPPFRRT